MGPPVSLEYPQTEKKTKKLSARKLSVHMYMQLNYLKKINIGHGLLVKFHIFQTM